MTARLCEMLCEAESQHAQGDSTGETGDENCRLGLRGRHSMISGIGGRRTVLNYVNDSSISAV